MIRRPPRSTLFPSTPLFRSRLRLGHDGRHRLAHVPDAIERERQVRALGRRGGRATFTTAPQRQRGTADRKSTRLNSSHLVISYAVFCLKKKNKHNTR